MEDSTTCIYHILEQNPSTQTQNWTVDIPLLEVLGMEVSYHTPQGEVVQKSEGEVAEMNC